MSDTTNAAPEPTWHKGMYGCREDMFAASVVLPLTARNAEHDRAVAEKAWEEGLDAGRDRWMDSREFGDKPVNPYRANPEPKEGRPQ